MLFTVTAWINAGADLFPLVSPTAHAWVVDVFMLI